MRHNNKVLIIDDEAEICMLLSGIVRKRNMNPVSVHSLAEAKDILSKEDPKVVFLDISLPDGSGMDLLDQLKLHHPKTKIVMISAFDSYEDQAIRKGADKFLSKPFNRESVLEALNNG